MEQKFEALKLVRKDGIVESNFKGISGDAKKIIDNAKPDALLVLTIQNNSPELSITRAEPYTEQVFNDILKR